jgi:hypothetical protein
MSNELTREQYLEIVNANIDNWPLPSRVYFTEENALIDSTYFLVLDDEWGLPLPFGRVALDEHFTGQEDQEYSTQFIIEVKYDD